MSTGAKSIVLLVVVAAVAGALGYGIAPRGTSPSMTAPTTPAPDQRQVLYWYDPMYPAQHFEKPGKSPFMEMQLKPRYAGEPETAATVSIDPARAQNLGIRLATVARGMLGEAVDVTGTIAFNERDVAIVQARAAGFVERTYRSAPGDVVAEGAPLADLYISEWNGAQSEFLALLGTGEPELIEAGRQRLRLLGMTPDMIADIERSRGVRPIVTLRAPIGGVIQTLSVRPGMTVSAGITLAEINGLGMVWLNAAVPEAQAALVQNGMAVTAELSAFPGETFRGHVAAILPEAQQESRTLKVRIELPNPNARLRPGTFATVHLAAPMRNALLVPTEAVIRTGKRNLVMVARDNGGYERADVEIGRETQGQTEILRGLNEGERVIVSGQFLIDSEASLAGMPARTQTPPLATAAPATGVTRGLYETRGRIEALTADAVTISHEPVPAIGWPAMTMGFRLADPKLAQGFKAGDPVTFSFERQGSTQIVRRMSKTGAAP